MIKDIESGLINCVITKDLSRLGRNYLDLIENVNAALPYMDADMRELAKRTLSKVDALTEAEFAELPIYAADEV